MGKPYGLAALSLPGLNPGVCRAMGIIFLTADRICSDTAAGPVCAGRGPDPVYGWGRANIQRSLKPVGKLRVVDESGQNAELAGSMLRAANPGVFAAISQVSTVAVDEFHRGFHANVLGSPMSRSKAIPELPAIRSKDEAAKTELYFGAAAHAVSVEFGQILTDRFSVNLGSGPAQDAFFGLESTGYAPLGLSGIESRFNAPYLALASAGTHMGAKYAFNSTSSLRFGVLSQSSKPTLNPQNKDQAARTVVIAELEHTKGNDENKLAAVATLGRVLESNGVLGLSGTGVFATEGSSDSEFLSLAATKAIGQGMSVAAMLSYGRSSAFENKSFSLFKGASSVSSAAWTVGVARSNLRASGDRLGLTVSMPLRAMSGYISLDGASSQNQADGSLNFERRVVRLAPSGRERRIELAYATPVRGGHLSVQANVRLQPGHLADARPDAGLGARLQLAW